MCSTKAPKPPPPQPPPSAPAESAELPIEDEDRRRARRKRATQGGVRNLIIPLSLPRLQAGGLTTE